MTGLSRCKTQISNPLWIPPPCSVPIRPDGAEIPVQGSGFLRRSCGEWEEHPGPDDVGGRLRRPTHNRNEWARRRDSLRRTLRAHRGAVP